MEIRASCSCFRDSTTFSAIPTNREVTPLWQLAYVRRSADHEQELAALGLVAPLVYRLVDRCVAHALTVQPGCLLPTMGAAQSG